MKVVLLIQNIVNSKCDAVVNAANNHLIAGSGVCGAIFHAAGIVKLQNSCNEIGYCETGNAVVTPGFDLNSKYIIHAVAPKYFECDNSEKLLYDVHMNILKRTDELKLKSVSIPAIGTGIYHCPVDLVAKMAKKALLDFENNNPNTTIELVEFSFSNSDKLDMYNNIFNNLV